MQSAHPGENWAAAFDGTYKPLVDLYHRGLIDAAQIQDKPIYDAICALWYDPEHGGEQVRRLSDIALLNVERDEERKITSYKFKIPWLGLKPFVPSKGARFNFMLAVNDNDGTVLNRKCALVYGGNLTTYKDTSFAHTVTLI